MFEEEDRISWLPDLLLVEIISRIKVKIKDYEEEEDEQEQERLMTTKEVIKTTSTISKRWQHLWTKLATLRFIYLYDGDYYDDDFTRIISNTLTQCPTDVNLNKFKLKICCSIRHTSQLNSWISYAISRFVQEVDLWLWDPKTGEAFTFYDELFFNNSCITRIKLFNCVFNPPPNATICWDQLKFLCIEKARLDGDLIGKILSASPCLETLELHDCYGVTRIDASSKNFENLVLTNYGMRCRHDIGGDYIDTLEINAPYMLSLTIKKKLCLEKLLLLNVSSLVKADFNYHGSHRLADSLGHVSSLVKADFNYHGSHRLADSLGRHRDDIEEELLSGLLSSLAHVKDITLGDYNCLDAFSRLRDKGFQFSRVGADGDEDRITQLRDGTVAAAAETQTEERAEEKEEYDDDMLFSLFD